MRLIPFKPTGASLFPRAALILGTGIGIACSGAVLGQGNPPPPHGAVRAGPPAAAVEACAGLAVDDVCPIVTPEGDRITGTCVLDPRAQLICLPNGAAMPGSE